MNMELNQKKRPRTVLEEKIPTEAIPSNFNTLNGDIEHKKSPLKDDITEDTTELVNLNEVDTKKKIDSPSETDVRDTSDDVLKNKKTAKGPKGLFLDTINRSRLEFDFEKVCSVSLSNLNVYACLVCGRYYKGGGIYFMFFFA